MDKTIICPGCGWVGRDEELHEGACPSCGYENGLPPYRLLTLSKMLNDEGVYTDAYLDLFLKSLLKFLGYPDDQDEWSDYEVVHYMSIDGG